MRSVCVVLIALLLLVACTAESGLRANKNEEEELIVVDADFDDEDPSSQRRELFGWLSFVFSGEYVPASGVQPTTALDSSTRDPIV